MEETNFLVNSGLIFWKFLIVIFENFENFIHLFNLFPCKFNQCWKVFSFRNLEQMGKGRICEEGICTYLHWSLSTIKEPVWTLDRKFSKSIEPVLSLNQGFYKINEPGQRTYPKQLIHSWEPPVLWNSGTRQIGMAGWVLEFAPNPIWVSKLVSMGIKKSTTRLLSQTPVLKFFWMRWVEWIILWINYVNLSEEHVHWGMSSV